jgi:3-dehydroquinate synthase
VGMILESYISYDKNWLLKPSIDEIKTNQGYIWWYSVCWKWHWSDTRLLIHDKKNEYGTVQFIEGIGKIKINQSVENELILKL